MSEKEEREARKTEEKGEKREGEGIVERSFSHAREILFRAHERESGWREGVEGRREE